jgi:cellulose synthase/poly-beta-1,6-N-acetylglucosamine synthase-like glycosyltransferase
VTLGEFLTGVMWAVLGYSIIVTLAYLAVNLASIREVTRYMALRRGEPREYFVKGDEPPISILVPAFNEQEGIVASVRSLLQLHYAALEVIVINDGSRDDTLQRLAEAFDLQPFPQSYEHALPTQPIRGIYASATHPNVRVIDKENGGKSDSLNAGINLSAFPLFCCVDADSILERDALLRIVQPFVDDKECVACGGVIRLVNGCTVRDGHIEERRLPRHPLALFQVVEYLRGILLARVGWSAINGLLVISGAFGLFRKSAVVAAGGYAPRTIGEDMELTVRLHRLLRKAGTPYKVLFVPDPVCWTEAPESLRVLKSQRVRWHLGLSESLWLNRGLCFAPRSGAAGWLAFPFWSLIEWLAPLVEFLGYVVLVLTLLLGTIDTTMFLLFTVATFNFGLLLSTLALVADALSFQILARPRDVFALFAFAVLENFGYRQLTVWWRVTAIFRWLTGQRVRWGNMVRKPGWQKSG